MKGGVKVVDGDWKTALAEAVRRRSDADALQRDGHVFIISPTTEGDTNGQENQTSTDNRITD